MGFTDDQTRQLKLLLQTQADAYRDGLNRLQDEVRELKRDHQDEIRELKKSLEFSQGIIDDLESRLKNLSSSLTGELREITKSNTSEIKQLNTQVNKLEDYSRKPNIRIDGVEEHVNENSEQTQVKVEKIIKEKLKLDFIDVEVAHRINKGKATVGPRTIIAKIPRITQRNAIFKNTWKLKTTGIFFNEDVSDGTMKKRKEQLPELKAAKSAGKIAYFVGDRLLIKNRSRDSLNSQPVFSLPTTPHRDLHSTNSSSMDTSTGIAEACDKSTQEQVRCLRPRSNVKSTEG